MDLYYLHLHFFNENIVAERPQFFFSGALVGLVIKALSHFALGDWRVCINIILVMCFESLTC